MDDGLVTMLSRRSVGDAIDTLAQMAEAKGMTVFGRVDYSAIAAANGHELRPTQLLLFGDPKLGIPLIKDEQSMALDMPLRALAWEDRDGEIWLTFTDLAWLARRHDLGPESAAAVKELVATVIAIARAATGT
jgi:uncharacterized protein (DUF302 family)